jgi:hypothetical protein
LGIATASLLRLILLCKWVEAKSKKKEVNGCWEWFAVSLVRDRSGERGVQVVPGLTVAQLWQLIDWLGEIAAGWGGSS